MSLSPSQIATVAARSGHWSGADLTIAVAVALAESGGDPNNVNTTNRDGSRDYGLWQINSIHTAILGRGNWADPDANAAMARSIYDDAGGKWTPWAAYNNQRYRLFMGQAAAATSGPGADVPLGNTESVGFNPISPLGGIATAIPKKLFGYIGGTWFMQRAGMLVLGAFLLLLALLKTRQGTAFVGKVKSTAVKAAEVAAVA